ncbi:MAG TPA: hypothetical protein VEL03_00415 [Streptosporangiaceae bacterium]|nr:hypothetical protein [Streptosporangiaceae bacterium]
MGQVSVAVEPAQKPSPERARRWHRAEFVVPCAYLAAGMVVAWRILADPAVRVPTNGSVLESDIYLNVWFMRYAATAVAHGHLPALITTALNFPHGINLMWNTSLLLPGVVLAPVTLLAGPTVSLAILVVIGFAGSATSLYVVLRRWDASIGAAVIGGAVYGFSPAIMVAAEDHYHLQFAVLPPLIADASLRLATGRGRPVRTGIWLGLLVAAQVFIAEELLADTAIVCLMLLAVLVVSRPARVPARLAGAAAGLAIAAVTALVICVHALVVQFHGPLTETGSPWHINRYGIQPADFVTAPGAVLLHGNYRQFVIGTGQWPVETFAYLGWPILGVVAVTLVACWRDMRVRMAGIAFFALEWLGIGNHKVVIGGWRYPITWLPWHWITRVHVLNQVLPNRFPILADGLAAVVLASAFDRLRAALPARRAWRTAAAAAAAALVLLPILPRPVPAAAVLPAPAGWAAVVSRLHLRPGAPVLVLPVTANMDNRANAMEWQAMSDAQISLVGGYCVVPGPQGHAVMCTTASTMTGSQYSAILHINWLAQRLRGLGGPSRATMTRAVAAWHPDAVVTGDGSSTPLGRYLISFFGPPTARSGQVLGWRIRPAQPTARTAVTR